MIKRSMIKRGLFITFEGIDGSGKTTQLELLYKELLLKKAGVIKMREPGSTNAGEKIRSLLADKRLYIAPAAELLLFFSSRVQLIEELIKPGLQKGKLILCDRFHDATVAYQSYGRGLNLDTIKVLENIFVLPVRPDRTFLLDCSYETAKRRMAARSGETRIEMMDRVFFERVREGYLALAHQEQDRIAVIDANKGVGEIHEQIRDDFFRWAGMGRNSKLKIKDSRLQTREGRNSKLKIKDSRLKTQEGRDSGFNIKKSR